MKKTKETILQEAQRLIYGDRNKDYGHPLDDFTRTADMATGMLMRKLRPGCRITAEEVGLFMILVKVSRQVNHPKRDNMTDTAGYAGTVQMVIEERIRRAEISKDIYSNKLKKEALVRRLLKKR